MQQDQETLMFGHSGFEETVISQQDTKPQHLDGTSADKVGGVQKWWQDNKVSLVCLLIILVGVAYAFGQMHQREKVEAYDAAQKHAIVNDESVKK